MKRIVPVVSTTSLPKIPATTRDHDEPFSRGITRAPVDRTLAMVLDEAVPRDDAGLEGGIHALATLFVESKAKLDEDAEADKRSAEVDALCAALRASPASVQTSKSRTVADTAQIDPFDGKLYTRMRDLNAAARSPIRNGHLQASLYEYSFHRLKRAGTPIR